MIRPDVHPVENSSLMVSKGNTEEISPQNNVAKFNGEIGRHCMLRLGRAKAHDPGTNGNLYWEPCPIPPAEGCQDEEMMMVIFQMLVPATAEDLRVGGRIVVNNDGLSQPVDYVSNHTISDRFAAIIIIPFCASNARKVYSSQIVTVNIWVTGMASYYTTKVTQL